MSEGPTIKFFGQKPCPKCMKYALEENETCLTTRPPIYITRRFCWACGFEERILRDHCSIPGVTVEPKQGGGK